MQSFKLMLLLCVAICCLWIHPRCALAQNAGFASGPLTIDPLNGPTTLPSGPIAPPDSPFLACACGCGIFEVGTRSMLPVGTGLTTYVQYAYQDQNVDWSGVKPAPASANGDKEIRTNFFTPGFQYMFTRNWGIQAELPIDNRYFQTLESDNVTLTRLNWTAIGDARIDGIYDGFFPDQSAGVDFGLKLPTGNFRHEDAFDDIDRDSEIGTGSTDLLLGGFYRNNLTADGTLAWFSQVTLDVPMLTQDQYRPGVEADGALGVYLNGLKLGPVAVTPIAQVLDGLRGRDSGINAAHPTASGYERVLLSPGLEFDLHPVMVYVDAELPVYAHITGDQLVAADLIKIIVSYHW